MNSCKPTMQGGVQNADVLLVDAHIADDKIFGHHRIGGDDAQNGHDGEHHQHQDNHGALLVVQNLPGVNAFSRASDVVLSLAYSSFSDLIRLRWL